MSLLTGIRTIYRKRLRPGLVQLATKEHPRLLDLLKVTGTLDSARNELRWLNEHARDHELELNKLIDQRATGKPLQYILGTEFFGDLEILCEPNVLIPRWETALSVTHLVQRLTSRPQTLPSKLRVLDLCTGTGCTSLLFRHVFRQQGGTEMTRLSITGIDLSQAAIDLANRNIRRQGSPTIKLDADSINFIRANIMDEHPQSTTMEISTGAPDLFTALKSDHAAENANLEYPILISNPPYVSAEDFMRKTEFSVRRFEPKLALVPSPSYATTSVDNADVFYPRLLTIADRVNAKAIMFEVGDIKQARRVAKLVRDKITMTPWKGIEIWNDQPTLNDDSGHSLAPDPIITRVNVRGNGKARSVFAYRDVGEKWFG